MRIAVIEDHALIRDLVGALCGREIDGAVVASASNAASGLALCRKVRPELLFIDLSLPDRDGLELLPDVIASVPSCKIIALEASTDEFTLHRALKHQVHAFIDRTDPLLPQIQAAVEAVVSGRRYLSPGAQRVREALRNDPDAFDKLLSDWEQELLCLLGKGLSNDDIARREGLSSVTIRNHRCRIMSKLGLHTTADLIHYATEKGFTRMR